MSQPQYHHPIPNQEHPSACLHAEEWGTVRAQLSQAQDNLKTLIAQVGELEKLSGNKEVQVAVMQNTIEVANKTVELLSGQVLERIGKCVQTDHPEYIGKTSVLQLVDAHLKVTLAEYEKGLEKKWRMQLIMMIASAVMCGLFSREIPLSVIFDLLGKLLPG